VLGCEGALHTHLLQGINNHEQGDERMDVRAGSLRGDRPMAGILAVLTVTLTMIAGVLAARPAPARAGAGDFCSYCDLNPHAAHVGNYRSYFYETESWNSDGKGVGSCTGVGSSSGSFANVACHADASGYNEVYCTGCNGYRGWWSIVENNSNHGYNSVFTGWESYA
jgi:hypothetical protein